MLYRAAPRPVLLAAPARPTFLVRLPVARLVSVEASARPEPEEPAKKKRRHVPYAVNLFVKDKMPGAMASYPNITGQDRMAMIMGQWKAATPEEQKPYRDESKRLKEEKGAIKEGLKATNMLTAYQVYTKESMAEAKKEGTPNLKQVFADVARGWSALPAATKEEYQRKARARNAKIWQDLDQEQ
ncbi:hypothetical protein V8C86DRAFT_3138192 [Haematococcus lacustris]